MKLNNRGLSLIEILISLAILGIMLTAAAWFFLGQHNSYTGQKERIALQENARSAMDFLTAQLRSAIPSTVTLTVTLNGASDITYLSSYDFGIASETGAGTTLKDNKKGWDTDQWQNYKVIITEGTGSSQSRIISSNTADTLTVAPGWDPIPTASSVYKIVAEHQFLQTGNVIRYRKNASGLKDMTKNVTIFTLTKDAAPTKIDVEITLTTPRKMADLGKAWSTTMKSTVQFRN